MIFEDRGGLKLPDICLTGEEKPRKISPRKLVPTGDRTRARCLACAHATACPTAVDNRGQKSLPFHVFMIFLIVLPTPGLHIEMVAYYTSYPNNRCAKLHTSILVLKYATEIIYLRSNEKRVRWSEELF